MDLLLLVLAMICAGLAVAFMVAYGVLLIVIYGGAVGIFCAILMFFLAIVLIIGMVAEIRIAKEKD